MGGSRANPEIAASSAPQLSEFAAQSDLAVDGMKPVAHMSKPPCKENNASNKEQYDRTGKDSPLPQEDGGFDELVVVTEEKTPRNRQERELSSLLLRG